MSTLPDDSHSVQAARKPASKIGTLRELLFALLQEHQRDAVLPTSARFLFYELVTRGQYSKVATGSTCRSGSDRCAEAAARRRPGAVGVDHR